MEQLFRSFESMIAELDAEIANLQRQINEASALRESTRAVLAGWQARYSRQAGGDPVAQLPGSAGGEEQSPPSGGEENQPPPEWHNPQFSPQQSAEQSQPSGEQPWNESNPSAWPSQS